MFKLWFVLPILYIAMWISFIVKSGIACSEDPWNLVPCKLWAMLRALVFVPIHYSQLAANSTMQPVHSELWTIILKICIKCSNAFQILLQKFPEMFRCFLSCTVVWPIFLFFKLLSYNFATVISHIWHYQIAYLQSSCIFARSEKSRLQRCINYTV